VKNIRPNQSNVASDDAVRFNLFRYKLFYFVLQNFLEGGNESIALQENNSTTSVEADDQASDEISSGSAIPLVTFRETKMERDSSNEKRDDGCGEDCESFHPADLLSFAWQIARGMVSALFLFIMDSKMEIKKEALKQQVLSVTTLLRVNVAGCGYRAVRSRNCFYRQ